MELFSATPKREPVVLQNFLTKEDANPKTLEYIEVFCNPDEAGHSTLGYRSPIEFEVVNKVS